MRRFVAKCEIASKNVKESREMLSSFGKNPITFKKLKNLEKLEKKNRKIVKGFEKSQKC